MQLGRRASKKYSDPNAWHNQFFSLVTTKIDEEIFKPLRDVPPYAIVGDVPARIIGYREKNSMIMAIIIVQLNILLKNEFG